MKAVQKPTEKLARSYLPKSCIIISGTEMEIQLGSSCYLFNFVNRYPKYGQWNLVSYEELKQIKCKGEFIKKPITGLNLDLPAYIPEGLENTSAIEIDGVKIPIYTKIRK